MREFTLCPVYNTIRVRARCLVVEHGASSCHGHDPWDVIREPSRTEERLWGRVVVFVLPFLC